MIFMWGSVQQRLTTLGCAPRALPQQWHRLHACTRCQAAMPLAARPTAPAGTTSLVGAAAAARRSCSRTRSLSWRSQQSPGSLRALSCSAMDISTGRRRVQAWRRRSWSRLHKVRGGARDRHEGG